MSAAERLDEIERRMDREVPDLNLHDRDDLRGTVTALRSVLAQHQPAATPYGHVCDECGGTYPCETVLLIDANLGGAS